VAIRKKTMRYGIMPLEEYKERTMKIVRGEYRRGPDEPKLWFESVKL
jgi:predicted transcriptional regulator